MYHILSDDRGEEGHRFVTAGFGSRMDAEEFAGNVGGQIVTLADGGDIAELVEAWHAGDFRDRARVVAGQILAELLLALGNIPTEEEELIERYKDSDPICERTSSLLEALR